MTPDENFTETLYDYFNDEAKRHQNIMAALSDVKAGTEAILAAVTDLIKENRDALSVLKDTAGAGHSQIMDEIVADNVKILEAVKSASGELKAVINTTPMPGQVPGPQ